MKKTYAEKLKDPRWQKMRLKILERDNWKCYRCEDSQSTLHVHHKKYKKGAEPWEYDLVDLVTLCEQCHSLMKDGGPKFTEQNLPEQTEYLQAVLSMVLIRFKNETAIIQDEQKLFELMAKLEDVYCEYTNGTVLIALMFMLRQNIERMFGRLTDERNSMNQLTLLDQPTVPPRTTGQDSVEAHNRAFVTQMRIVARTISLFKKEFGDVGSVSTDDLRFYCKEYGIIEPHYKVWSSIFRGSEWIYVTRKISEWPSNNGRKINVYSIHAKELE